MNTSDKLTELEEKIEKIEQRNKRVELNKAWETGTLRKVIIAILTYLVMVLFFHAINVDNPWINAVVPTLGFLLSTLSLSLIKQLWINSRQK